MNIINKTIHADIWRKQRGITRFSTLRGEGIPLWQYFTDVPRSAITAFLREFLHIYPQEPWVPYPAIRELKKIARPDWKVLEHGAGSSTAWWAKRVFKVQSIESNFEWYNKVQGFLKKHQINNVDLQYKTDEEGYSDLSGFPDHHFNIIVIDGHARDKVASQAARLIVPGGYIYLDDTDKSAIWEEHWGQAVKILLDLAEKNKSQVKYFRGVKPGDLTACEGMLIKLDIVT